MITDQQLYQYIGQTIGVDSEEIFEQADFELDLNATQSELDQLKTLLEEELDIELEEFTAEHPTTVKQLKDLIEDAL